MAVGCFCDTCSVSWGEGTSLDGPCYEATVNLDPNRAITCLEGLGLGVALSGAAGNLLAYDTNTLLASLPAMEYQDFSSDRLSIPIDATTDADGGGSSFALSSDQFSFPNNSGRDGLLFIHGSFLLRYAIVGDTQAFPAASPGEMIRTDEIVVDEGGGFPAQGVTPFNAQWYVSLVTDNATNPTTNPRAVRQFATSGITVTPGTGSDLQFQYERVAFTYATPLANGVTHYIKHRWAHQGSEQTINVAAGGTGVFSSLGGYMFGQALLFPLTANNTL